MKRTTKKIVASLLALLMMIQMVPALAATYSSGMIAGSAAGYKDSLEIVASKGTYVLLDQTLVIDVNEDYQPEWSSGNPGVATVDGSGVVTAVSAGTATITATVKSPQMQTASVEVTVIDPEPIITESTPEEPAEDETPAEDEQPAEETPAEEEKPAEETPAEEEKLVEETPAEETSIKEETPAEEQPAEETPAAEEKPAEEKPAEETPAEEVKPVEEKPAEETPAAVEEPAEEEPEEEAPVTEEKPVEEKPVEKPAEEKPATEAPAAEKPAEAPAAQTPAEETPAEVTPEEVIPEEEIPEEETPAEDEEEPEEEEEKPAEQTSVSAEKKNLVIVINGENERVTYDGEEHLLDRFVATANEDFFDESKLKVEGNVGVKGTDCGIYELNLEPVTFTYDDPNVIAHFVINNGFLKITPATVTVTAKELYKNAGDEDPELVADVIGLFGKDTIEYTLTREPGEDVGDYVIKVTGDEQQGNYRVDYVDGKLGITGEPVVTIEVSVPEGQAVYLGTEITLTAVPAGFGDAELTYQWQYSTDGENYIDIEGANSKEYKYELTMDNVDYEFRVSVDTVK